MALNPTKVARWGVDPLSNPVADIREACRSVRKLGLVPTTLLINRAVHDKLVEHLRLASMSESSFLGCLLTSFTGLSVVVVQGDVVVIGCEPTADHASLALAGLDIFERIARSALQRPSKTPTIVLPPSPAPAKSPCPDCGGAGKIQLFTSEEPCRRCKS